MGASDHKFSSGSHADGRICAKSMVQYCVDNKDLKVEFEETPGQIAELIYKPVRNFLQHKNYTTAIDINPHYITPKMLQFRLQKIANSAMQEIG